MNATICLHTSHNHSLLLNRYYARSHTHTTCTHTTCTHSQNAIQLYNLWCLLFSFCLSFLSALPPRSLSLAHTAPSLSAYLPDMPTCHLTLTSACLSTEWRRRVAKNKRACEEGGPSYKTIVSRDQHRWRNLLESKAPISVRDSRACVRSGRQACGCSHPEISRVHSAPNHSVCTDLQVVLDESVFVLRVQTWEQQMTWGMHKWVVQTKLIWRPKTIVKSNPKRALTLFMPPDKIPHGVPSWSLPWKGASL